MVFNFNIGLKLHSTNIALIPDALRLKKEKFFDYIELFVVPGSKKNSLEQWKEKKLSYILHAPHSYSGLNLSLGSCESENRLLIEEVDYFRIALKPAKIIFHPGIQGSTHETIRQILLFKRDYPELFDLAIIENKPKIGLKTEVCVGSSPEEIEKIMAETGIGFCLDIGHAIYYSAWAGLKYEEVIDKFLKNSPSIYHLSDGDVNSQTDLHLNFGEGNFELAWILQKIPTGAYITIETNRNMAMNLKDYKRDVIYLKRLLKNRKKLSLRPATMEDSDFLLEWRNDPQTRIASHNIEEVQRDEHVQWLHSVLQNKNRKLFLAEEDGELVGTVRADYADLTCELSWTVAPNVRGQGLGKRMVALIINQLTTKIKAKIKKGNQASIRIAEYVGMVFEREEKNVLYYSKQAVSKGKSEASNSSIIHESA